jgi:murein DD-endopeptidase MepM/ murein hydrolase activator NlpD
MDAAARSEVKYRWSMLVLVLLPLASAAAEKASLTVAKPVAAKRFFPLETARATTAEKQNGVTIIREKKPLLLRSDRQEIANGGLLIDRARSVAIPKYNAPIIVHSETKKAQETVEASLDEPQVTTLEPESDEIEGLNEGHDPVLALFDDEDSGELLSFADAMRGISRNGARHHIMWPIPLGAAQKVTSGYGVRSDPFHGRPAFHGGIDIAAAVGTPVLATADGSVIEVKSDGRYGKYIGIKHSDGTISRYGHLSAQQVAEGQNVRAGQAIGAVGSTGRSTGAHLDYRVSRNGMKFDPLAVLTVPSSISMAKAKQNKSIVSEPVASRVATNALPKRPMVIKVQ